jgi:dolichol-phosphate mannosyltransferase
MMGRHYGFGEGRNPDVNDIELTVAIMTRNEAETLPSLLEKVRGVLASIGLPFEILIVDGHSTDRTREEASARGCRVVLQPAKGLGDAVRHGFRMARGRFVVTMDADHSHPPELLRVLAAQRDTADLILASRYVVGGASNDIPKHQILSRILNRVYAVVLGLPYGDISTGYRIYRKSFLDRTPFEAVHYDIQEETVFRIHRSGGRIREIPLHFQPRQGGESKASVLKQGVFFARTLLRLWNERVGGETQGCRPETAIAPAGTGGPS